MLSFRLSSNAIVVSLWTLGVVARRCGVTVVPKHATVLGASSGAISTSWVFRTPRSHVTCPRNASGRTVISLLGTLPRSARELDLLLWGVHQPPHSQ